MAGDLSTSMPEVLPFAKCEHRKGGCVCDSIKSGSTACRYYGDNPKGMCYHFPRSKIRYLPIHIQLAVRMPISG
jgi:hypothetical protein